MIVNTANTFKDMYNSLMSWVECEYCNSICSLEKITSDCYDNPVCDDCVEEHKWDMD